MSLYTPSTHPKKCPHCGAPKTNRGTLATQGRYTGFACRTWVADYGTRKRSVVCESREAFNRLNPANHALA